MKAVLENQELSVCVEALGAQLSSIFDRKKGREVLWEADPKVWGRHAPILFPFVGRCVDGKYLHEGITRAMTPHGFARDKVFDCVSRTEDEVWFRLTDDADTRAVYPFCFRLEAGYRLRGRSVEVSWRVVNTGENTLYFMIGGHPAFRTPEGKTIYDFTLEFEGKDRLHYEAPNEEGYADAERQGVLELTDGRVPVTPGFFDRALTYIFDGGQAEKAALLVDGEPYVTVACKGFPYLGVWTEEKTHPFVCLEPWYGRCADKDFTGELKDRNGILALNSGRDFNAGYTIEIH